MHSVAAPQPLPDGEQKELVLAALSQYQGQPGPLLQVLHAVQDRLGYIPAAAIPIIAEGLNLSRADVFGVVTFYHHFRSAPAGKHMIRVCQAEACRSMHSDRLTAHAQARLGVELNGTTADGLFTLEPVYCLGNCACSPSMLVDEELHARVTPEAFDALIDRLKASS